MTLNLRPSKPETISRLESLKPGETYRYYRGKSEETKPNPETPHYSSIIGEVFEAARRLNEKGRIEIRIKDTWIHIHGIASPIKVHDFIAVGAPAK
jgi:hypothetical protein